MLCEPALSEDNVMDQVVLILVLMEYALRALMVVGAIFFAWAVLILVLMEYALRGRVMKTFQVFIKVCLNPCFNGICSARFIRLPY